MSARSAGYTFFTRETLSLELRIVSHYLPAGNVPLTNMIFVPSGNLEGAIKLDVAIKVLS